MATKLEKQIDSLSVDEIQLMIRLAEDELKLVHRHEREVKDRLIALREHLRVTR